MRLPLHNVQITHWNEGASFPLIIPVHVVCNTPDEIIDENIRRNSRLAKVWQKVIPQHDGIAILCGSGPSLGDTLDQIREWVAVGGKVFAMNGAAKFLSDHGIFPDYQVMIDAREQTADLIGPAREHLFASQVSPECFARVPDAKLWHLQVKGIDGLLPEYRDDYCLIGGAASVGNTATCLAYAMGYRRLEIFGYDSSHRDGKGHAFRQPMNDGDPCAEVDFNGKTYICSMTMRLQAEKFMETSKALRDSGCVINVHGSGLLPDVYNSKLTEAEKYKHVWSCKEYRRNSPGEKAVAKFLELAEPHGRVIDFGCGTGRAAVKISEACDVLLVDFADNCRDPEAQHLPFLMHDLTKPMQEKAPFGFCSDVMEHIPPEDVDSVIQNILNAADTVFFQISTLPDDYGQVLVGEELHLTVKPHAWWREKFLFRRIIWEEETESLASFLVTLED